MVSQVLVSWTYSMRRLIMSALVAACLAPLPGSTLLQLSLNDMIQKSTMIVRGTMQPTSAAFRGAMIYTHYQVAGDQNL